MRSQSCDSELSLWDRCYALLEYADEVAPVEEPAGDSLAEWHRWREAYEVRVHVASLLSRN